MSDSFKVTPASITEHFNPAWFAAIMGTAVIPLAISFVEATWVIPVAWALILLSVVMFVVFLLPWTLKFFVYPASIRKDLNHPIAANFFPTMPISLILLALNLKKYPTLFFSETTSIELAYYCWLIGSVGIYVMGFTILIHIFRNQQIQLQHANFGWYIPPVSKLLIPVSGFELAAHFPERVEFMIALSTASFGIGLFLFLFVGAAVYHRYIYHELPMSRFAATFFIGIAPPAIIAVILYKVIHLFGDHHYMGIDPTVIVTLCTFGIVMAWGFAVWWHVMAVVVTAYYITRMELPYALSWWAFTFPSGALCVASGVAWQATGFGILQLFYHYSVIFMLLVWVVVLIHTLKGMISGKVFAPSH